MTAATSTGSDIVGSVLTAVVASLLGAAGLWFQEWRTRRRSEARRRHELEEAQAYLAFMSQWFSTHAAVAPGVDIARTRLWASNLLVSQLRTVHTSLNEIPQPRRTPFWARIRRLLLLYPLRATPGSLVRLLFYSVLIIVCSVTPGLLLDERVAWGDRIGAALLLILLGFGLLFGLGRLVARLSPEADGLRTGQEQTGPEHEEGITG
ncbi:hypothetical protein [Streptomyces sp. NPDC012508]|uniref:hypothetical protein n=1 Tax=Streptomyces sp. NPDC012508 TaxID=3364837 RepID=UPI00367CC65F